MKDLIHIAKITSGKEGPEYLFLKKENTSYRWFQGDTATDVVSNSIEKAMRMGYKEWKEQYFRPVHCGFRYVGPERDEHGINAYFYEMAKSQASMSGIYMDNGVPTYVQGASQEALRLLNQLEA